MLDRRIGGASIRWYLKQLLPQSYKTEVQKINGDTIQVTWKMWFGHTYNVIQEKCN